MGWVAFTEIFPQNPDRREQKFSRLPQDDIHVHLAAPEPRWADTRTIDCHRARQKQPLMGASKAARVQRFKTSIRRQLVPSVCNPTDDNASANREDG